MNMTNVLLLLYNKYLINIWYLSEIKIWRYVIHPSLTTRTVNDIAKKVIKGRAWGEYSEMLCAVCVCVSGGQISNLGPGIVNAA